MGADVKSYNLSIFYKTEMRCPQGGYVHDETLFHYIV